MPVLTNTPAAAFVEIFDAGDELTDARRANRRALCTDDNLGESRLMTFPWTKALCFALPLAAIVGVPSAVAQSAGAQAVPAVETRLPAILAEMIDLCIIGIQIGQRGSLGFHIIGFRPAAAR